MNQVQDDAIDFLEFFKTLWDGKSKIIVTTFVATLAGVIFGVYKPNSFEVSTPIQVAKTSVFLPYTSLNYLLKEKGFYSEDEEFGVSGYKFDADSVFDNFVVEFNDYREMIEIISEDEFVKQSIQNLDDIKKQRKLIDFAKKFEIKPPSKRQNNWLLHFEWHDDYEGRRLFNNAIRKTLINLKNSSKRNIDELAKTIDNQNSFQLEKLQNDLNALKQNEITKSQKQILFLNEQYAIATELGIKTNKIDTSALSQNAQNQISFNINQNDVPYYLRGYKAIKKEIELIKSRSTKDILLMADNFVELNEEIALIKNDKSSSQLKNAAKFIENDNPEDWVEFDLKLADAESQKKMILYVAISIFFGGMVGVVYVLILNAIRKARNSSAKVSGDFS